MKIKAPAKVNIFLKITGTRDNYHTLRSRFVRIDDIYDTISFNKKDDSENLYNDFLLQCNIELPRKNTVSFAYKLLAEKFNIVKKFFKDYKVIL